MDPSDAVLPEEVELPRDGPWKVIYRNEGWSVAVCTHYGTGEERVGIRWNAYVAGNGRLGYPSNRGHACWFVLPVPVGHLVRAALRLSALART